MEKITKEELMKNLSGEVLSDEELENVVGGIQWSCFGQCITDGGGENIPELAGLMSAIDQSDWVGVTINAAAELPNGRPLVIDCWNAC